MSDTKPLAFDLEAVNSLFSKCLRQDGEVSIDQYIEGYAELCKLFNMFGTVFTFVVTDVTSKLEIMTQHRRSEVGPHYITVQSMVNYEIANKITTTKNKLPSGSRTLLRLHRALEFIILFLERLLDAKDDEKLHQVAYTSYNETLSNYHGWMIRKAVGLALYMLPTRAGLLDRMDGLEPEVAIELIQKITTSGQAVYNMVQVVYKDNDILDLP